MPFAKLTSPMILDQALALFYSEGISGVSIRKVAASLDVNVASLYWHVKDRDTLYGLMVERIFWKCLSNVPAGGSWQQWLHGFGLAIWHAQISHVDMRTLMLISKPVDGARDAIENDIVRRLLERGLERYQAEIAHSAVQALVTGWSINNADAAAADEPRFLVSLDVLISGWQAAFERAAQCEANPAS
jgi:TetR/AcrR family tetracycline transcriptional repressor